MIIKFIFLTNIYITIDCIIRKLLVFHKNKKENENKNISFKNAKFKGSSYVFNPNNSTINYNLPPEILSLLLENQKNITQSIAQQNELLQSLLVKR